MNRFMRRAAKSNRLNAKGQLTMMTMDGAVAIAHSDNRRPYGTALKNPKFSELHPIFDKPSLK